MLKLLPLLLGVFIALSTLAEDPPSESNRVLKQKAPSRLKSKIEEERWGPTLEEIEKAQKSTGLAKWSLSTLIHTASLRQDLFNKPFQSAGTFILVSIPITRIAKSAWIHSELGIGLSYAKVTLTQPDTTFTHLEFPIPLTVRLMFALSRKLTGELLAGVLYRPLYYESRTNTSGGFQSFSENPFTFEGGLGVRFPFSSSLRGRLRLTYSYIAGGLEFIW